MESSTTPLDLSRSLRFQSLISRKGSELCHMFLLTINRKQYMASPMTAWHLTLSDLECQGQGQLDLMCLEICMVYMYLPAIYYHFNLDTKESLMAGEVLRCPSGLSCIGFIILLDFFGVHDEKLSLSFLVILMTLLWHSTIHFLTPSSLDTVCNSMSVHGSNFVT